MASKRFKVSRFTFHVSVGPGSQENLNLEPRTLNPRKRASVRQRTTTPPSPLDSAACLALNSAGSVERLRARPPGSRVKFRTRGLTMMHSSDIVAGS